MVDRNRMEVEIDGARSSAAVFAELSKVVASMKSDVTNKPLQLGTSPQGEGLSAKFRAHTHDIDMVLARLQDRLEAIIRKLSETTQTYAEAEEHSKTAIRNVPDMSDL